MDKLLLGFTGPPKLIGEASFKFPALGVSLLFLGALACCTCVYSLFPLWLAISLGALCILGALSLAPVMATVLPRQMVGRWMEPGDTNYLFMGVFFFLSLAASAGCLFFIPIFWLSISAGVFCFILGFPLSTYLTEKFYRIIERRRMLSKEAASPNYLDQHKNSPDFPFIKGLYEGPYVASDGKQLLKITDGRPSLMSAFYQIFQRFQDEDDLSSLVEALAEDIAAFRDDPCERPSTGFYVGLCIIKAKDTTNQVLLKRRLAEGQSPQEIERALEADLSRALSTISAKWGVGGVYEKEAREIAHTLVEAALRDRRMKTAVVYRGSRQKL